MASSRSPPPRPGTPDRRGPARWPPTRRRAAQGKIVGALSYRAGVPRSPQRRYRARQRAATAIHEPQDGPLFHLVNTTTEFPAPQGSGSALSPWSTTTSEFPAPTPGPRQLRAAPRDAIQPSSPRASQESTISRAVTDCSSHIVAACRLCHAILATEVGAQCTRQSRFRITCHMTGRCKRFHVREDFTGRHHVPHTHIDIKEIYELEELRAIPNSLPGEQSP